ncbi:MAG TPA: dihydrolipoamide acetyltransferase family protein [Afifellaceae bacterium]|nr:dihydrolipoamide acetyltransferase family protein [Afifellaceae bacterium]
MNVIMPQLGETVSEGTIGTWYKKVGDRVEEGEALFEIETDKVTMEVTATEAGTLSEIHVQQGETAPVGTVVAVIGDGAAAAQPAPREEPKQAARSATGAPADTPGLSSTAGPGMAPARGGNGATPMAPFREVRTPERGFGPAEAAAGIKVTPLARRMIALKGLDLEALAREAKARGGWRIGKREIEAALAEGGPATRPQQPAAPLARLEPRPDDDVVPLNLVRRQTAKHLASAWQQIPHVVQAVEIDFGRVDAVRATRKEAFRQTHGVSLSYLPFIARAVVLAIAELPRVNARFDGDRLLVSRRVRLGVAVDLSHEGLVVPVVRNADELNVTGLANAIGRLVRRARAGELTPDDLSGATYTISNNGSFGTLFTAPIISAPQVAILSTDAVRKRPVVVETEAGDAIMARPVGVLAQSFDHRAFDGAYSAAFLARLKDIIETRDWAAEFA